MHPSHSLTTQTQPSDRARAAVVLTGRAAVIDYTSDMASDITHTAIDELLQAIADDLADGHPLPPAVATWVTRECLTP